MVRSRTFRGRPLPRIRNGSADAGDAAVSSDVGRWRGVDERDAQRRLILAHEDGDVAEYHADVSRDTSAVEQDDEGHVVETD